MNNTANQTNNSNNNAKVSDAAKAYENMAKYNYEFIIAKNRNTPKIKLVLDFKPSKFYHLCGLHDLKIDTIQSLPRTDVFKGITGGTYKDELFQKNQEFHKIVDRIECLIRLEEMLDSNDTVFKFNQHRKGTSVECDYIVKNSKDNRNYFYMISKDTDGNFFGRSCFNRDAIKQEDFSAGHAFYYTLYKAKLTVDEHGQEVDRNELFVADSFRKELEEMKEAGEIKRPTSALSSASSALTNNSNNNSNNIQNFSIEPQQRWQYNIANPVLVGQAAGAMALPLPTNPPPLFDMDKIINALENLNEKIVDTIHNFADTFKRSREQPPQDRTARGRKINLSLPFPKEKPSQERTEPVTAKSEKAQKLDFKPAEHTEKKLSWIAKEISSAKREANENNKNHEPKHHDKDQSL